MFKITVCTTSLVERLCDFKIYSISVLSFIGCLCTPDKATTVAENHALQCTTSDLYNAMSSSFSGLAPFVAFVLIWWALYCISSAFRYRVPACSTTLSRCLEKISTDRGHNCTLPFRCPSHLQKSFLFFPGPLALRMNFILFVGWTVLTHSLKFRKKKKRKILTPGRFWTNFMNKTVGLLSS